jgi:hypothetical protein
LNRAAEVSATADATLSSWTIVDRRTRKDIGIQHCQVAVDAGKACVMSAVEIFIQPVGV